MNPPAISELLAPITARGEAILAFGKMLPLCPTAASRRRLIIAAHESELINDEDAETLLRELAA